MPKTTKILCDTCGADITSTGNSVDWRIALINQHIPSRGGMVTDMWITPQLKDDVYFCNAGCLRAWIVKNIPAPNPEAYKEALEIEKFQNASEAPLVDGVDNVKTKDEWKDKSPEDDPDFHSPGSSF